MENPVCQHCGKTIKGRTDKRFCDDTCRNNFNRIKRQGKRTAAFERIPEIIRIIKNNHEILWQSSPQEEGLYASSNLGSIKDLGINPEFFTSIYQENGTIWRCCFDYGWREYPDGGWEIGYFPSQAIIAK